MEITPGDCKVSLDERAVIVAGLCYSIHFHRKYTFEMGNSFILPHGTEKNFVRFVFLFVDNFRSCLIQMSASYRFVSFYFVFLSIPPPPFFFWFLFVLFHVPWCTGMDLFLADRKSHLAAQHHFILVKITSKFFIYFGHDYSCLPPLSGRNVHQQYLGQFENFLKA